MLLTKLANQEIINFLKTVTIKNSYFADQLKSELVNSAYQSGLPEDKNPYYLHLTGQYILKDDLVYSFKDPVTGITYSRKIPATTEIHTNDETNTTITVRNSLLYKEGAFDEMMYVASLDVPGTTIPFTVELLHGDAASAASSVHKKTREAYRVPGKYFDVLCKRYPKQIDLIKSIVYLAPKKELSESEIASLGYTPSDSELRFMTVRDAEHLSLINCDSSILEDRERDNIVAAVQAFLDIIRTRWDVKEYTMLEAGYANVHWAMIWSLLPLIIQAQRYSNIRTYQVHSSHIWDHLISNGLSSYKGYLTPDEEWYLYKNIRYLRENAGQHRILNYLIDNLLASYGLHIESKTSVLDKTDILKEEEQPTNASIQCDKCARKSVCYKNIRSAKCNLFIGYSDKYKPTAVILSEELYGAQEKKIIAELMRRHSITEPEAKKRYDLSFMWRDEEIITIREELDRDQTVDMTGVTEELDTVIQREYAAKLEPLYNNDVVDSQQTDLRHVKSTYLPTKLLEIVEDRKEPKYHDMFMKFLRDTLLHMTIPGTVDGNITVRIDDTYTITCGQDAAVFNLSYNELLGLLYYGVYREDVLDIDVSTLNTSGRYEEITGVNNKISSTLLTDNKAEFNDEFYIPNRAFLGTTFRLAKPVKIQDLVAAYYKDIDRDVGVNEQGIVTYDSDKDNRTGLYALTTERMVDGEAKTISIFNLITNADLEDETLRLIQVGDDIYAITARGVEVDDALMWKMNGVYINILGKFYTRYGAFVYHENTNDEVPILPEYFIWHKEHLGIRSVESLSDIADPSTLTATIDTLEDGEHVVVWNSTGSGNSIKHYKYTKSTNKLREVTNPAGSNITLSELVKASNHIHPATSDSGPFTSLSQNLELLGREDVGEFLEYCYYGKNPITGEIGYVNMGDVEVRTFDTYKQFVDINKQEVYAMDRIEKFLNVDWILEHLWMDFMSGTTDKKELGAYIEKMFNIYERVDAIRSSCGDIKTKLAIDAFMEAALIKREQRVISMSPSFGAGKLTYKAWFDADADIRNNINKLNHSEVHDNAWNTLNSNIMSVLLDGCGLDYISGTSYKTRYNRLRALIRSLSSYLINFIDTSDQARLSTEISHVNSDTGKYDLVFTSYVNFDYVGEVLNRPPVRDPDKDIYILETGNKLSMATFRRSDYANEDEFTNAVNGFVNSVPFGEYDRVNTLDDNGSLTAVTFTRKYYTIQYKRDIDACEFEALAAPTSAMLDTDTLFYKINLHDLLNSNDYDSIKLVSDNDVWQFHRGNKTEISKEVETFFADPDVMRSAEAKVYEDAIKLASDPTLLGSTLYYKQVIAEVLEYGSAIDIAKTIQEVLKLTRLKFMLRTTGSYPGIGSLESMPAKLEDPEYEELLLQARTNQ